MQTDAISLASTPAHRIIEADLCIVGSGPAGATLARELARTKLSIVLLESGGIGPRCEADALNETESIGAARFHDRIPSRNRGLGGTSRSWSGRCARLDEIDFLFRPWVPHSGWPIAARELAPYFDRSEIELGLAPPPEPERAQEGSFLPFCWQYSRGRTPWEPVRFANRLPEAAAGDLRIFTDATVVHVNTNDSATLVEGVEVATPENARRTVRAPCVVLATGGIENARLLLASNRHHRAGLGNDHDLVGRFLMDHLRGGIGAFDPGQASRLASRFGMQLTRRHRGSYLQCRGMRLGPRAQASEHLLNCAIWLSEIVAANDPWSALKRVASGHLGWREAAAILGHGGLLARGIYRSLSAAGSVPRKLERLEMNCIVEQQPDPASRVTLSDRTDRHGMPVARLDWRVNDAEYRTVRRVAELAAGTCSSLGLPRFEPEAWIREDRGFPSSFSDVSHHIGTTRMAHDPVQGVVDSDCQVHGVRGLYVAGSSVFPTGGHANPTHTIIALSLRLADTLRERLAAPVAVAPTPAAAGVSSAVN